MPSKVVAAQALASIGSEAEGQTAVAAAGGVSALCLLTTVDDLDCRHAAVTTLASLTEAPACCEEALRHKALPRLLGCLSRPAAEGLQLPAARVLLSLCQCPGAVPVLKKSEESIPILLAAATDSPPQVRRCHCHRIHLTLAGHSDTGGRDQRGDAETRGGWEVCL